MIFLNGSDDVAYEKISRLTPIGELFSVDWAQLLGVPVQV
jgi:hypothetical protein